MPIGVGGGWRLIFADEFNGQVLDSNKWIPCYWWNKQGCTNEGNHELQWYRPENISVSNGSLYLTAKQESIRASDGKTYDYSSGMVTTGRIVSDTQTPVQFAFQYGYIEIRAKIPKGKGLWPAFWILPTDHISKPEIDVLEVLGHETDKVYLNFHYQIPDGKDAVSQGEFIGSDFAEGWHTYGVDWKPDGITWFIDGTERRTFTDRSIIPSESMYLILNLAVGGDWPGAPDENTIFPNTYQIDYVRVWKRAGDVTLRPIEDTFVDIEAAERNYGRDSLLSVDNDPERVALLKFDLTSVAGAQIQTAWLRVKTTRAIGAGSANGQTVHLVNQNVWNERVAPDLERLTIIEKPLGVLSKTEPNILYDIPLDVAVLQTRGGQMLSLMILNHGDDGLNIYSREFKAVYPELILKLDRSIYSFKNHAGK